MPDIAAIVLAAGGSVRMGRPKQLLTFQGRTLVRCAVEAVRDAGCDPVLTVVGSSAPAMIAELAGSVTQWILNDSWKNGIGTSIRAGVAELLRRRRPPDAAVIHLCDQPLVDSRAIAGLIEAHARSRLPVCVSTYLDTMGPPIVVSAALFDELVHLPDNQGAKAIWTAHPEWVSRFPCPAAATDLDTPADVERLGT